MNFNLNGRTILTNILIAKFTRFEVAFDINNYLHSTDPVAPCADKKHNSGQLRILCQVSTTFLLSIWAAGKDARTKAYYNDGTERKKITLIF